MHFRPPRFSMRSLLVAMLLVGVLLGVVGRQLSLLRARALRERAIIARLEQRGAKLEFDFNLNRTAFEPLLETMEGAPYPHVSSAFLRPGSYAAADIAALAELEDLRNLTIWKGDCDDAWLAALANAKSLHHVSIEADRCTAAGARVFAASTAPLVTVSLVGVPVDDAFLRRMSEKRTLEQLVIEGEGISAAGLGALYRAERLWDLRIHGGQGLGEGLAKLAELPSLKMLVLRDYQWSEQDLAALSRLKSLHSLCIESPRLPRGVLQAAATLPNLRVLQLIGQLDQNESLEGILLDKLEIFSTEKPLPLPAGFLELLAKSKTLRKIDAPGAAISEAELERLAALPQLEEFAVGESPSKEAIGRFQDAQPYCVYIDGRWGLFQPRIGINLLRMGGMRR